MNTFIMENIIHERGLILWIPENPDGEQITNALLYEIGFIKKHPIITNKDIIIPLLKEAIRIFDAYPNRILRFYHHNNDNLNNVMFSWENPSRPITSFMYRYNP